VYQANSLGVSARVWEVHFTLATETFIEQQPSLYEFKNKTHKMIRKEVFEKAQQ